MIREELEKKVLTVLQEAGFEVAQQISPSCFDILARKDTILLIKVLTNIDSLYEEQADDLKRIAKVLNAIPLLVGIMARGQYMRERTLYERFSIPATNFETFEETILEKKLPFVYSKRGGYYAHINADFLKKLREKHNLSLAELAREAGLSKATIQNYERGEGAEVENIMRLQETLGDILLDPINLFEFEKSVSEIVPKTPVEKSISGKLGEIGFKTTTVTKASFSMIGKHKEDLLLTGLKKQPLEKKAHDIHDTASTLGQHGMFVFEHARQRAVSGVPILERAELNEVVTSKELLKILRELSES